MEFVLNLQACSHILYRSGKKCVKSMTILRTILVTSGIDTFTLSRYAHGYG